MASALCSSFSGLSLGHTAVLSQKKTVAGFPGNQSRGSLVIVAAQNSKKRERTSERNRLYNKSRRSAMATRIKKVLKAVEGFSEEGVKDEAELQPLQKLINEAYQEIDKAVVKGIMHKNTAARRKSRMAVARQNVLISSGLYTPAPSQ